MIRILHRDRPTAAHGKSGARHFAWLVVAIGLISAADLAALPSAMICTVRHTSDSGSFLPDRGWYGDVLIKRPVGFRTETPREGAQYVFANLDTPAPAVTISEPRWGAYSVEARVSARLTRPDDPRRVEAVFVQWDKADGRERVQAVIDTVARRFAVSSVEGTGAIVGVHASVGDCR